MLNLDDAYTITYLSDKGMIRICRMSGDYDEYVMSAEEFKEVEEAFYRDFKDKINERR